MTIKKLKSIDIINVLSDLVSEKLETTVKLPNQISLTGGIPFSVSLPKAPVSIHADGMTTEEIHQKLEKGYNDIAAGKVQNATEAFAKFRENH